MFEVQKTPQPRPVAAVTFPTPTLASTAPMRAAPTPRSTLRRDKISFQTALDRLAMAISLFSLF